MTFEQAEALLVAIDQLNANVTLVHEAIDALEWAAAVLAKTVTLIFGVALWCELRRVWTQGAGLF